MAFGRAFRSDRLTGWHATAAMVMAALAVAASSDAWRDIYLFAHGDDEYSHIFLVPLVVAWILWVRRMRFRHCKPSGRVLGPILAAIGWFVTSYGFRHNYQSLWHGGAILLLVGCVISVLGKHVLFRFFPAFVVLLFLIPVPGAVRQRIALPLQNWTAHMTQVGLQLCAVETDVTGNTLVINGVPVRVAEACNGMRMVFPLILITFAFAYGLPLRQSVRVLVLLCSPAVAILCNVLRTMPTTWLYGNGSRAVAEWFHDWSAWAMLPITFGLLLLVLKLVRWTLLPVTRYPLASQYA